MQNKFDVIVVGGGPGGSSTTLYCASKGYKVLLIDKKKFPRDKICGDALGGKGLKVMKDHNLLEQIDKAPESEKVYGVIFSSPKGKVLEVGNPPDQNTGKPPAGYVCPRKVTDNILFQAAKKNAAKTLEEHTVLDIIKEDGKVVGVKVRDNEGNVEEYMANVVVGADGASSLVGVKVGAEKVEPEHHVVALRQYWEGVEGMSDKIELHFMEGILPGYFWIFPLPNGKANVGIGILTKFQREQRIDLKKSLEEAIEHPMMKDRFKNAKPLEDAKGWGLPLGSKRRKGYGDGFLLVGDACSLIDPFSGEGVGNALISGKLAASVIDNAHKKGDFSAETLKEYDELLKEEMDEELQTMYKLQKLGRHKFLLNLIIDKAVRNKEIRDFISNTLTSEEGIDYRKKMASPGFWLKVLIS
ncbi:MAG: geranylgeranyl reductase family protein [Methanobacteriota archaeon]|nr:MAG: geranylgeranyl reductase family protein [Euryarchaeota archaeon]